MKRFLLQLTTSVIGIMLHFLYTSIDIYKATSKYGGAPFGDYLTTYTDRFEFLNGLTIALLLSFFVYIISKYIKTKNIEEILKGSIVPIIILIVPGFLLGCFGPLLEIYKYLFYPAILPFLTFWPIFHYPKLKYGQFTKPGHCCPVKN